MTDTIPAYAMNPAEDVIRFGDELTEGMLVLPASSSVREGFEPTEEQQLRNQRFRKVTRLKVIPDWQYGGGAVTRFVGEWVDGYQEVHSYSVVHGWLVKKDSIPAGDAS